MRTISAALCSLLSSTAVYALSPELGDLNSLPMHSVELSSSQTSQIKRAEEQLDARRFAVSADLPVTLEGGLWDILADGSARWRTRVYSAGASSLNFALTGLTLSDAAELWLYDADGTTVQGPYTSTDVSPEGDLWTAIVPGETAILELRVPASQQSQVQLHLSQVNHGFRSLSGSFGIAKSGSCNIDVVCSLGDDWRDEIRSVARITIGGQFLCSGQLVNNVREDETPLFLTADHCGVGDEEGGSAASVVVYWNYVTSSCGGTPNGSLSQSQSGTTLLADDVDSDFTLLQLNQPPAAAFNVYYAGWDVTGNGSSSGVSIHHPRGDEKRISAYNTATTATDDVCIEQDNNGNCLRAVDSWRVIWSQGTTEGGSSGSGLWNADHRIIGVLSGGLASCSSQNQPDYYGRLSKAWTASVASSGQLKAWLDPDDTGASTFDGMNPDTASVPTPTPTPTTTPTPTATPAPSGGDGGGGAFGGGMGLLLLSVLVMLRHRRAN